jgi:hypothetical protein
MIRRRLRSRLQRFLVILDHSVFQYDRAALKILVLAHVLVGEPDPTSSGQDASLPAVLPF